MKFYTLIEDNRPHKPAGNNVTSCFRSAFIDVRQLAENEATDGFVCGKYSAVLHSAISKASSNFSSEEYRQRLRLKRHGVSSTPPYGGLLVLIYRKLLELAISKRSHNVALDSLYISTGNDIIIYFQSAAKRISVFILGQVLVVIYRQLFSRFQKGSQRWTG